MNRIISFTLILFAMGLIQLESVQAENFNVFQSFKMGLEAGYYNNQESTLNRK